MPYICGMNIYIYITVVFAALFTAFVPIFKLGKPKALEILGLYAVMLIVWPVVLLMWVVFTLVILSEVMKNK